jgi:hypothetical protein
MLTKKQKKNQANYRRRKRLNAEIKEYFPNREWVAFKYKVITTREDEVDTRGPERERVRLNWFTRRTLYRLDIKANPNMEAVALIKIRRYIMDGCPYYVTRLK